MTIQVDWTRPMQLLVLIIHPAEPVIAVLQTFIMLNDPKPSEPITYHRFATHDADSDDDVVVVMLLTMLSMVTLCDTDDADNELAFVINE